MYDVTDMTPTMKVSFDDSGTIVAIGPSAEPGYSYFEKDFNEVKHLITLQDDPMNYVVRFDNNKQDYVLIAVNSSDSKEYKISKLTEYDGSLYSLLLQIDYKKSTAILKCDNVIRDKLNIDTFTFYFTKKDNPNYLYKSIEFKINETIKDKIFLDIKDISIYTVRNLERLSYEVV